MCVAGNPCEKLVIMRALHTKPQHGLDPLDGVLELGRRRRLVQRGLDLVLVLDIAPRQAGEFDHSERVSFVIAVPPCPAGYRTRRQEVEGNTHCRVRPYEIPPMRDTALSLSGRMRIVSTGSKMKSFCKERQPSLVSGVCSSCTLQVSQLAQDCPRTAWNRRTRPKMTV